MSVLNSEKDSFLQQTKKMATYSNVKKFLVMVIFALAETIFADDVKEVYGVVSGSAHLPCNITSPVAGDSAR